MSRKCRGEIGRKKFHKIKQVFVLIIFTAFLGVTSYEGSFWDEVHFATAFTVSGAEQSMEEKDSEALEIVGVTEEGRDNDKLESDSQEDEEGWLDKIAANFADKNETTEEEQMTDLTDVFDMILKGVSKDMIAGYVVDEAFLMWFTNAYGEQALFDIASSVQDGEMDVNTWYEASGDSMHVLWVNYCKDSGFQQYQLDNVYWTECSSEEETVISFSGDFNFAEGWFTTERMDAQANGIFDCFSEDLLAEMKASDITMMNNEFVYSDRGTPLPGKAYTFRAMPERVDLLKEFGVDIVSLANNHTYDYGSEALIDTMKYLEEAGIAYVGAGSNLEEASKVVYYVANGKKIAIVSATEIERSTNYTKEATENTSGVLKTLRPEKYIKVIEHASEYSDYVIAVTHWGTEGTLYPDNSQRRLAELFVEAGADVIIGGHPHRLQGVSYVKNVPVAYSLGNFWFSDGTLYTTLAQVIIKEDGALQLKYLPCIQKDLTTSLITDTTEKEAFYHYLATISSDVGMDADGNVYNKKSDAYPAEQIVYDSETSSTNIIGATDNEGNAIDIVGNLK